MEDVWEIVLNNYKGEDDTIYFKNYKIAKENFDRLKELYEDMPEFQIGCNGEYMSWYDHDYNEYDTYIYLLPGAPKIYNEILF